MDHQKYLLVLPLVFPMGVAPGAGGAYNQLKLARNGRNEPILRGTSLAGVLRHAYARRHQVESSDIAEFFGSACGERNSPDDGDGMPSRFKVADCVLNVGQSKQKLIRTHHLRDRHTKTVVKHGLFSLEACPPGTSTTAYIWFHASEEGGIDFISEIASLFKNGLHVGGNTARGVGRVELNGPAKYRRFDLRNLDDHAAYLDSAREVVASNLPKIESLQEMILEESSQITLQIKLRLRIPRGQDILVADGQGENFGLQPQCTIAADGAKYWRIPGSSLRGSLKTWMTKVAAKAGHPVADSFDRRKRFQQNGNPTDEPTGENLGRAFLSEEQRAELAQHPERYKDIACPIARLFGSLYQASRITISDSLVHEREGGLKEQIRMHVAVDRITGGAAESMLFDNTVLVADRPDSSAFEFHISIREPRADEVQWLRAAIVAIDLGLLRLGSSKSAGRLELANSPDATGRHAEQLVSLVPQHTRKK